MRYKISFLAIIFTVVSIYSQQLPEMKLKDKLNQSPASSVTLNSKKNIFEGITQVKKRKAVTTYFGAGYSFVIFTDYYMNRSYPVFNQSAGDFLSEINVFFGFAIAKAVTLEIEPSVLFTNNNKLVSFTLNAPKLIGNSYYTYANPGHESMLAFMFAGNARYFPFYKNTKSFIRLFFFGGGAGMLFVREEYDNYYANTPGINYYSGQSVLVTESTSQWAPLFRGMIGFTGAGGMFGFGGELRFNYVPLKVTNEPFATRYAKNFNSVDLALRFYFSL